MFRFKSSYKKQLIVVFIGFLIFVLFDGLLFFFLYKNNQEFQYLRAIDDADKQLQSSIDEMHRSVSVTDDISVFSELREESYLSIQSLRVNLHKLHNGKLASGHIVHVEVYLSKLEENIDILWKVRADLMKSDANFQKMQEDVRESRHAIFSDLSNASMSEQLYIAKLGYYEKEFLYQYLDEKHAQEWLEAIESFDRSDILDLKLAYNANVEKSIGIVGKIQDLEVREAYTLALIEGGGFEASLHLGDLVSELRIILQNNTKNLVIIISILTILFVVSFIILIKKIISLIRNTEYEKNKLQITFENMGDAAFVIDQYGVITLFNVVASKLTGFNQHEALGKHYKKIINLITEKTRKVNYKFIDDAINKKRITKLTNHTLIISKDKQELPVTNSAAPLYDSYSGKIIGVVVVIRDVSVEYGVDKMKDEFLSLASHQLRTPLTAVRWFLEMLLNGDAGKLKTQQRDFIDSAFQSTLHLVDLVNSLLNITRIEAGKLSIKPEKTDVLKFSNIMLKEFKPLILERKHTFVFKKPRSIPLLNTDSRILREILGNLLSNAIKYTAKNGKIVFYISVEGKNILFTVKDNGFGIPKKQEDQIFHKFFRADNILKKDTVGTGLGLVITKSLTESLGGTISFSSRENHGSTFCVNFPLKGVKPNKGEKSLS